MIGPGVGVRGPNPTLLFSESPVLADGVSPSQPEAKCDWARGGCSGAKSNPFNSSRVSTVTGFADKSGIYGKLLESSLLRTP